MNNDLVNQIKINKNNNLNRQNFEQQKIFLKNNLRQDINKGLNLGLREIFSDIEENNFMEIKNNIITKDFKADVKSAVDSAIEGIKNYLGDFAEQFKNIPEIRKFILDSNLINSVSKILDCGIDVAKQKGLISKTVATIIKEGKNILLNSVKKGIDDDFKFQTNTIKKMDKYVSDWYKAFENTEFNNMEKQYKKIEKELDNIIPLEDVIKKARQVENLHNLIKNNGKNFNLSKEELKLANQLI